MARPLTKRDNKGLLYIRPAGIESKIDEALAQDLAMLAGRAKQTDPAAADYLPSECLVHLIRDAIRTGDFPVATKLMPTLLIRCERNLLSTVPDRRWRDAEAIREQILSDLALLFADDANDAALDFYECKFARSFATLRIDHLRTAIAERKHLQELPESNAAGAFIVDDGVLARLSRAAAVGPSQEDAVYLPQVLAAIDTLPPPERETFVLRRLNCLTEKQAAQRCGVDERTIRNRLARADEKLKNLKEDL
ncbi:MAG: sigma factor-like helix-turn-helix DNA-binding protein [Rhodomicrobium sp.]